MRRIFVVPLASLIMGSSCLSSASAQAPAADEPPLLHLNMPRYLESYLAQLMLPFRRAAGEDQILTQDEMDEAGRAVDALRRSQIMAQFFAADLDGDLTVNITEWRRAGAVGLDRSRPDQFINWDSDKNNTVTVKEVYDHAKIPFRNQFSPSGSQLVAMMNLEPAQDGTLTAHELEQAGREAFGRYDRNQDGVLSSAELKVKAGDKKKLRPVQLQKAVASACGLPKVGPGEKVLFVTGYEAAALSTVSVAGQDEETNTAEIHIEEGKDPLFIIATSYTAMIWRVTGAVERVSRFVTGPSRGGAGVIGLSKDHVSFAAHPGCLGDWTEPGEIEAGKLSVVWTSIGRPASGVYSSYTLSKVILPAESRPPTKLQQEKPKLTVDFSWGPLQPADNLAIKSLKRFSPGGVIEVNAEKVVSSAGAEPYEVLPQEAGLAQLLQDGALRFDPKLGYLIQRPISRFPAGLAGAHSVRFVLAKGVPRPAGNAGHSVVLTLEQAGNRSTGGSVLRLRPGLSNEGIDTLRLDRHD